MLKSLALLLSTGAVIAHCQAVAPYDSSASPNSNQNSNTNVNMNSNSNAAAQSPPPPSPSNSAGFAGFPYAAGFGYPMGTALQNGFRAPIGAQTPPPVQSGYSAGYGVGYPGGYGGGFIGAGGDFGYGYGYTRCY